MSNGELIVSQILNQNNIHYQQEKTFNDLKHGLFRFDFYISDLHGRRAVIEFNGQQHYQFTKAFYQNHPQWEKAKEHDRRKISYCLANDIDIYIIPYWDMGKLKTLNDLLKKEYKAKNRWHNDYAVNS